MNIDELNKKSIEVLENTLLELEEGKITSRQLAASTYANLIALSLIGYDVKQLSEDSVAATGRLNTLLKETEENGIYTDC